MSRGKHLSLHEARKTGQLERFAKEHEAVGDRDAFEAVLKAMATGQKPRTAAASAPGKQRGRKKPAAAGTSGAGPSAGSSGTQSREDKSGGT